MEDEGSATAGVVLLAALLLATAFCKLWFCGGGKLEENLRDAMLPYSITGIRSSYLEDLAVM